MSLERQKHGKKVRKVRPGGGVGWEQMPQSRLKASPSSAPPPPSIPCTWAGVGVVSS